MNYDIQLQKNEDSTFDIIVNFDSFTEEISKDFFTGKDKNDNQKQSIIDSINETANKVKVKSIRILSGGILLSTLSLSSFQSAIAADVSLGYLYAGTEIQQIEFVKRTKNSINMVAPSYFDINQNGVLVLNPVSKKLVNEMHEKGVKVTPFLSNHWNRQAGIDFLKNYEANAQKLSEWIHTYNLDGINIDIENVTHAEKDQYTNFVASLKSKLPSDKIVSVAVAANPKGWTTGWHGSYDYKRLAEVSDYLVVMAYDEHYQYGEPGPVASIDFVENSIKYALKHTSPNKIVLGMPFYGRIWSNDNAFQGAGVDLSVVETLISDYNGTISYHTAYQSPKVEFSVQSGDPLKSLNGKSIEPGEYVIWYENSQSIKEKASLIQKYNLKGAGNWALGKETPSIWNHYANWIGGVRSFSIHDTQNNTDAPTPEPKDTPSSDDASQNNVSTPTPEPKDMSSSDDASQVPPPTNATPPQPEASTVKTNVANGMVVNVKNLNVRSKQSTASKVVAKIGRGSKVTILKKSKKWYYIQLSNGKKGYVHTKYIRTYTVKTTSKAIGVYSKASTKSKRLGNLKKNAKVTVYGTKGKYSIINYKGKDAFIKTSSLKS